MQKVNSMLVIVGMLLVTELAFGALPAYEIIDLDTQDKHNYSYPHSINNKGQIVGQVRNVSHYAPRAILFDNSGAGNNIELGALGDDYSVASSINNEGQVVGLTIKYKDLLSPYATVFDTSGAGNNTPIGTESFAYSNNDDGQIIGGIVLHQDASVYPVEMAVLFDSTGGDEHIILGTLDGYEMSLAFSINNNSQIVGVSFTNLIHLYDPRATLFDTTGKGNNIDLGSLGEICSNAVSNNDNGQIVGFTYDVNRTRYATLFDPTGSGANINLGTLEGWVDSQAFSINNLGQIVGRAHDDYHNYCAVLFDVSGNGNNIDLNTLIDPNLGWILQSAEGINDNGWIVGHGINPDGNTHAFLLIPKIEVEVEITPRTLNLSNSGKWISCHIWLPEEYDVADVNTNSISLEGQITAAQVWGNEEEQVVMTKFSRADVQDILEAGEVELIISGELIDGARFEGKDTIRVIDKGSRGK
jgi:uncharacterized membrane protein